MTTSGDSLKKLKRLIHSVLVTQPKGIQIKDFSKTFSEIIGHEVPYKKHGHTNLRNFLLSCHDTVNVFVDRCGNEVISYVSDSSTRHVERLVSQQKSNISARHPSYKRGYRGQSHSIVRATRDSTLRPIYSRNNNNEIIHENAFRQQRMRTTPTSFSHSHNRNVSSYQCFEKYVPVVDPFGSDENSKLSSSDDNCDNPSAHSYDASLRGFQSGVSGSTEDECVIHKGMQEKIKKVLSNHPEGLWTRFLPIKYKESYGYELDMADQGFHSVVQLVSAMPHIVRVEGPFSDGDWLLFDASQPKTEIYKPVAWQEDLAKKMKEAALSGLSERHPINGNDHELLTKRVHQVLQFHGEGILLKQLPTVYQEMTGLELRPSDHGEKDMPGLLILLSRLGVLYLNISSTGLPYLHAIPCGERRHDHLKVSYRPLHPFAALSELVNGQVPAPGEDTSPEKSLLVESDVVGPGIRYKRAVLNFPPGSKVYHEIIISNILSLKKFWIQRRTNVKELEDLMSELKLVYAKDKGRQYRMPEDMMVSGQVCAAKLLEDGWHRCIINCCNQSLVQVYYVDYGNTEYVAKQSVCYLLKKFITFPVQAMQARLSSISPPNGEKEFSDSARKAFQSMSNAYLFAQVTDIKECVLHMIVLDTKGQDDIYFNDHLVEQGYAVFENASIACSEAEGNGNRFQETKDGGDNSSTDDAGRLDRNRLALNRLQRQKVDICHRISQVRFQYSDIQLLEDVEQSIASLQHIIISIESSCQGISMPAGISVYENTPDCRCVRVCEENSTSLEKESASRASAECRMESGIITSTVNHLSPVTVTSLRETRMSIDEQRQTNLTALKQLSRAGLRRPPTVQHRDEMFSCLADGSMAVVSRCSAAVMETAVSMSTSSLASTQHVAVGHSPLLTVTPFTSTVPAHANASPSTHPLAPCTGGRNSGEGNMAVLDGVSGRNRNTTKSSPSILQGVRMPMNFCRPTHCLQEPAHRLQEPAHRLQEPAHRLQEPAHRLQEPGHRLHEPAHRLQEPGHRLHEPAHHLQEQAHRLQEPGHRLHEPALLGLSNRWRLQSLSTAVNTPATPVNVSTSPLTGSQLFNQLMNKGAFK